MSGAFSACATEADIERWEAAEWDDILALVETIAVGDPAALPSARPAPASVTLLATATTQRRSAIVIVVSGPRGQVRIERLKKEAEEISGGEMVA